VYPKLATSTPHQPPPPPTSHFHIRNIPPQAHNHHYLNCTPRTNALKRYCKSTHHYTFLWRQSEVRHRVHNNLIRRDGSSSRQLWNQLQCVDTLENPTPPNYPTTQRLTYTPSRWEVNPPSGSCYPSSRSPSTVHY